MSAKQKQPRRPGTGYRLAAVRQIIRYVWNRTIIAVAIRAILILYALLQVILTKCRTEQGADVSLTHEPSR